LRHIILHIGDHGTIHHNQLTHQALVFSVHQKKHEYIVKLFY